MVDLEISVNNDSKSVVEVTIETEIFELDSLGVKDNLRFYRRWVAMLFVWHIIHLLLN